MSKVGRLILLAVALATGVASSSSHVAAGVQVISDYPGKAADFHCATQPPYSGMTHPYSITDKEAILQRMHDAGVTWVRIYVMWAQAEPNGSTFDSVYKQGLDDCVRLITGTYSPPNSYGMKVLLVPYGQTPAWAQPGYRIDVNDSNYTVAANLKKPPSDCLSATASCANFKGFVQALMTAYPTTAKAVEIWNEPNNRNYLRAVSDSQGTVWKTRSTDTSAYAFCPQTNPTNPDYPDPKELTAAHQQYTYLLKAGSDAVNHVALVVLGGAVNASYHKTLTGQPTQGSIQDWLTDLYADANVSKTEWDVVGIHPFPPYANGTNCPSVYDTLRRCEMPRVS